MRHAKPLLSSNVTFINTAVGRSIGISISKAITKMGVVVLLPAVMAGCATLSKEECQVANWEAIGFSDGASGYGGDRLSSHNKACAKANISPDYPAWERGRQQGLKQYCTQDNAYQIGKSGRRLNAVCPAVTTPILQRINADGLEVYRLSQQIQTDKKQLDKNQTELKRLREGDNLGFATEAEARDYLLSLPAKIRTSEERINSAQQRLVELQRLYGY